ncbi:MAG: cell division protein FtsQ/DivIB [Thermoleophilia bacterium]
MDPRIKQRRRGVTQARGRRRLVAFATLLLAAAGIAGFLGVRSSDVFAVRRVSVPVTQRVSESELRAAVSMVSGVNLLRVSTGQIEAGLRSIPYVRAARVYRRFPDSLEMDIVEYEPVARVEGRDGVHWLLADDGRVLEKSDDAGVPADAGLPLFAPEAEVWPEPGVVTAPQIVDALPLVRGLGAEGVWSVEKHPLERVVVTAAGEMVMVLAGGGEVRLGDPTQLDEKLMVALEVVEGYLSEGRKLEYVDVHVPGRVVAKAK